MQQKKHGPGTRTKRVSKVKSEWDRGISSSLLLSGKIENTFNPDAYNDIETDNIPLVDYGSKEDKILRDIDLEGEEESMEELDVTKIYRNELEMSGDELDEINRFGDDLFNGPEKTVETSRTFNRTTLNPSHHKLGIDLNSDVCNEIALESVEKIHEYLEEDEKRELALAEELRVTEEQMGKSGQV